MTSSSSPGDVRRWYVTGSHRLRRQLRNGPAEVPYGQGHVRQIGSPATACGLTALNWPIFWVLQVTDLADMCSECKLVVLLDRTDNLEESAQGIRRDPC